MNKNWFMNLKHARDLIEDLGKDYNGVRPHSSLNCMAPMEYAEIAAAGLLIAGDTNIGRRSIILQQPAEILVPCGRTASRCFIQFILI